MSRPRLARRTARKMITIPEDVIARVDLYLYSPLEGRVPYGAWPELMTRLLTQWLAEREQETPR